MTGTQQRIRSVSVQLLDIVRRQQEAELAEQPDAADEQDENVIDLSKLKSRELDKLAGIFKFWSKEGDHEAIKINEMWNSRLNLNLNSSLTNIVQIPSCFFLFCIFQGTSTFVRSIRFQRWHFQPRFPAPFPGPRCSWERFPERISALERNWQRISIRRR